MTSRAVSASTRSSKLVEPARSANMTVTVLRTGPASGASGVDLCVERRPAPAAEARGRTGFHTARRTDPRERCAATLAEAGVLFVRRTAGGASAAALGHRQSGLSANASWSSIAVAAPLNMVRISCQLAVVDDVDLAGADDGIDEAPRRGEPVVASQFVSGVIDSVFGETLGVPARAVVLTSAPRFGGEALAQEVSQIVCAPALCGDLPIQRRSPARRRRRRRRTVGRAAGRRAGTCAVDG